MRVKNFWRKVIQIYILLVPFISAFAPSQWLPLALVFVIAISFLCLSTFLRTNIFFFKEDSYLLLMVGLGLWAMIFSINYLGTKNISHLAAISLSIFFFYFVVRSWLRKISSIRDIASAFTLSLLISSLFIIFEFIASNFWGIPIPSIIPYPVANMGDSFLVGHLIRPRGFAEEAGHMALFYEMALPISLLDMRYKPVWKIGIFGVIVFLAFFLLASTSAIIALAIATFAINLKYINKKWSVVLLISVALIIAIAFSFEQVQIYAQQIIGRRLEVIFLNPNQQTAGTVAVRTTMYLNALALFLAAPWGIGWGTASQLYIDGFDYAGVKLLNSGFISFYGEILIASGIFGLLFFLLFIFRKIIQLINLRSFESQLVLISIISMSIHYLFISNYWYPMFWLSLALGDKLIKDEKRANFLRESFTVSS